MSNKDMDDLILKGQIAATEFMTLLHKDSSKEVIAKGQKVHIELLNILNNMQKVIDGKHIEGASKPKKKSFNRDMTKYTLEMKNPVTKKEYTLKKLSKRKLPSEVYKHLIESEEITAGNIEEYQINRFERNKFDRKFAPNTADILFAIEDSDAKRYEPIDVDCQNIKNRLYVVNQWDKDSIDKFIEYMNEKFKNVLKITAEK